MTRGLALLAAALVLGVAAAPASATFPGANGRIGAEMHEFDRGGELNWELRLLDPGGANRRSLLRCDRGNVDQMGRCPHNPSFSADGKRLAFDLDGRLVVAAADGSAMTTLPPLTGRDTDPHWSPDGTKLVFTGRQAGKTNLYLVGADGSGLEQLTSAGARAAAWSSRGRIAYVAKGRIYLVGSSGHRRVRLARGVQPDWTPSGRSIVYQHGRDAYRIRARAGSKRKLLLRRARRPVLSPDATRIAFVRLLPGDLGGTYSLFSAPLAGGRAKLLLRGGEQPIGSTWNVYGPLAWQPLP